MMQRHARILLLALGIAGLPSREALAEPNTREARAPDVASAERYAALAFDAYRQRDFASAVSLYARALAAAPSADILYNIARVYDLGLHDRHFAIQYYEAFVREPQAAPKRLDVARQRLFELHAAERASLSDDSDVIARDFPMDEPTTAPLSPAAPHDNHSLSALEVTAISLGTAGLVGVGVGVGFGLSARSETDAWKRACEGNACSSQRGVDAAESASRRATIATLGFGVGGGLLAVAMVLWLVDSDGDAEASELSTLQVSPAADGSGLAGVFCGHF